MFLRSMLTLAGLLLASAIFADDVVYRLDGRNTEIGFVGSKKDGKHDGGFKELKGTVTVKDNDPTTAQFKVDIDMRSIFTDTAQLTGHLKSADFFNVQKYPTAKFVSTKVEKKDGGKFEIHGKLTMNGVTKETMIPAKMEVSDPGLSIEGNWEISRFDWRINFKPKDIDEKVKLSLKVTAPK